VTSPEPSVPRPRSVRDFVEMKARGRRITCLTCYDVLFARLLEEEGIDVLLVGDSLGQVVLGYETTLPVTLDEMLHHCRAVRRGAPKTFTVLDLPFLTYQPSVEEALRSAGRALKEGGAHAVKLEGGDPDACDRVDALVRAGIPVMGHLGLTPQSVHALGGYRVQGRGREAAKRLGREAGALEAGLRRTGPGPPRRPGAESRVFAPLPQEVRRPGRRDPERGQELHGRGPGR
jgi:3-methyl-2-oxobutanoate hydroxymethyltransferase